MREVNAEKPLTEKDFGKMVRLRDGRTVGPLTDPNDDGTYWAMVDGYEEWWPECGRYCRGQSKWDIIAVLDPSPPQPAPSEQSGRKCDFCKKPIVYFVECAQLWVDNEMVELHVKCYEQLGRPTGSKYRDAVARAHYEKISPIVDEVFGKPATPVECDCASDPAVTVTVSKSGECEQCDERRKLAEEIEMWCRDHGWWNGLPSARTALSEILARHESALAARVEELTKENERLKRGDFTDDEFVQCLAHLKIKQGDSSELRIKLVQDRYHLINYECFCEGNSAALDGKPRDSNPYTGDLKNTLYDDAWDEGWRATKYDDLESQLSTANAEIERLKRHYDEAVGLVTKRLECSSLIGHASIKSFLSNLLLCGDGEAWARDNGFIKAHHARITETLERHKAEREGGE